MTRLAITVRDDGRAEAIYHDDLAPLMAQGRSTVARASHVEPDARGGWCADMRPSGGPVLGASRPFATRQEALDAEVEWLQVNKGL